MIKKIIIPGNGEIKKEVSTLADKPSPQSDMLKDVSAEREFLKAIKKGELYEVKSELELMTKVYNEQLEQMCRMRIDIELFDYLIIAEPTNNQHQQQRTQTKESLKRKRKLIQVIRGQILQQLKGQKSGKKD